MTGTGPKVAVVDEDASRLREIADILDQSGFAAHAFTSARSACQIAIAVGFDAMLVEHGIREMPLHELQQSLERRLGASAPQFVVLTRRLHEMPIPERSRYVAVLRRPVEIDTMLAAVESAVARRARAAVLGRDDASAR